MESERPNYYSVIPADVRYDRDLKDKAKLLYGEISSLCNREGYCYANNKYFAELYGVSIRTITDLIKNLVDKGYILSETIKKDGEDETSYRCLKIVMYPLEENFYPPRRNLLAPLEENFYHNNINNNNKETYNNKLLYAKKDKHKQTFKPTIEELRDYCLEKNLSVDVEYFYDYYEANGWMVGKTKMKDWKATLRNWNRRDKGKGSYETCSKELP